MTPYTLLSLVNQSTGANHSVRDSPPTPSSHEVAESTWVCGTNWTGEWQLVQPVCSTRYHSVAVFVSVAMVLSLITLWTILGNLLVLLALCRYGTLRTMSNCLIGNLAISDLLLAITVLPISTGHDLLGYWVFGESTCTMWLCVDVLYCTASIWGLCTVAFDRYLATVYPVWYHDQRSVKKAVGCIVFVWIFSIIISFAPFIGWQHMIPSFFSFNPRIRRYECILFTSSSYVLYSSMGSFIIPAILMAFMYVRIFVVLHNKSRGAKKRINAHRPRHKRCPDIREPSVEELSGVARDATNTTLVSVAADSSTLLDVESETKMETDQLLALFPTQCHVSPFNGHNHSTVYQKTCHNHSAEYKTCHKHSVVYDNTCPLRLTSLRSNSFALPNETGKENGTTNSISEFDRRNSHNITKSPSDTTDEFLISPVCHRSKSTNTLTVDTDEPGSRSVIPRRSLPCNMPGLTRNHRMTMSMKRRFELREQRATKRMLLIMACFCVCWMPFLFVYILRSVCMSCDMNQHFVAAIIWLGYVNSSLNPVLYTLFNDDFKTAFKRLIGLQSAATSPRPRR